jgi:hypothetical protein
MQHVSVKKNRRELLPAVAVVFYRSQHHQFRKPAPQKLRKPVIDEETQMSKHFI